MKKSVMEPIGVECFRCELEKLGVRVEPTPFKLVWKCAGGDLNLGYVMGNGKVWTDAVGNRLPEFEECCESFKQRLAYAWGGEVKEGSNTRWVVKGDGSPFLFHSLGNQELRAWIAAIKQLQQSVLGMLAS